MKKRHFLFLFGIVLLLSCSNNSKKSNGNDNKTINPIKLPYFIDIEKNLKETKPVSLSSIGKELEYIPLETTPYSMMGQIQQIEFCKDFIFIATSSPSKLMEFDRKGKFIRQVGANGRGPGEYIGVSGFCIDHKNEKVFISSCWADCKILEYNFKGEYIRSFKQPWESTEFLVYDTIGLVFEIADYSPSASGALGNSDYSFLEYNLFITDFDCIPLFKIKRHLIRNSNFGTGKIAFYYFDNKLHFQQFGVDTLYTLNNKKLDPYVIFNLGKGKMDPNLTFPRSNIEIENLIKKIEKDTWMKKISENEDFIFSIIELGLSDSSKFCIYNKQTSKTIILDNNGFINDLDGGISFWPKYIYNDSILVDYIDAFKFLNTINNSKMDKNKFHIDQFIKLTETSNPVIIVLR